MSPSPPSAGPLELVAAALKGVLPRANEAPHDIGPLLYSAFRREQRDDDEIQELLHLEPGDVPLRIVSYQPDPEPRVRLRPPGPVAAIHTAEGKLETTVVRCTTGLMFLRGLETIGVVITPNLTASALAPHEDLLLTGDAEGSIAFWRPTRAVMIGRYLAHRAAVTHVLLLPTFAYSCAADGSIMRWEWDGEGWKHTSTQAPAGISSAAASIGDSLMVGCQNGDILEVDGTSTNLHARAHDGPVTGLALRHEGQVMVSAGADRMLRACMPRRPDTAVKFPSDHTHGITGLAASLQPDAFATYSPDRTVRLWSVKGTSAKPEIAPVLAFAEHEAAVTSVHFARSGSRDVIVSGAADGGVVVRYGEGDTIASLHAHEGPVRASAIARKGTLLTGGDDASLRLWTIAEGDVEPQPAGGVTSIASAKNTVAWCQSGHLRTSTGLTMAGAEAVAVSQDGQRIAVWIRGSLTVNEGQLHASLSLHPYILDSPVVAVVYVENEAFVTLENGIIVSLRTEKRQRQIGKARITCVIGKPGDSFILTGHADGEVVRTLPSETAIAKRLGAHAAPVTGLAMSTGAVFASGSVDGSVMIWATANPRQAPIRATHNASVRHLAFFDETHLVTAGEDGIAILWGNDGKQIATCTGHRKAITGLVVDDRSKLIYTASLDATIRVWDSDGIQRGIVYGTHPFSALALIPDHAMPGEVIAGDDAGAIWTLSFEDPHADQGPGLEGLESVPGL